MSDLANPGGWSLTEHEPVARDGFGFWDGFDEAGEPIGGIATDLPRYAPRPDAELFRFAARGMGYTLGEIAETLGLTVVQASALRRGRLSMPLDELARAVWMLYERRNPGRTLPRPPDAG